MPWNNFRFGKASVSIDRINRLHNRSAVNLNPRSAAISLSLRAGNFTGNRYVVEQNIATVDALIAGWVGISKFILYRGSKNDRADSSARLHCFRVQVASQY
ncbi:MAG: hypothetical protein ACI9G1_004303 [Pirellulaceae bacterium]